MASGDRSGVLQEGQFLDGWELARHMGITERPFMVRFRTDVAPWSWRRDRFSPLQLAELWRKQLTLPEVNPEYPLGVYIHVPFCTHSCAFCRCFRVQVGGKNVLDQYLDFLCAQMDFFGPVFEGQPIRYFSVGGGTPTILNPAQLARMFTHLRKRFAIQESPLATVEMSAPTMIDRTLRGLVDSGIPRVSVGVQTLDPAIRSANHMFGLEPSWLEKRVRAARGLGLHCNLDLVLGLPDEPPETFLVGFQALLAMQPSSVIVNILNRNYFERIKEEDAVRGRDTSDYLRIVGEGMMQAASRAGYLVYPHSNTIEAVAFFSPEFDAVAHQNWPVLERLASGILSVHAGTSVLGLGSLVNLALLPDWLIACHSDDLHFDPSARVYQATRKEVFSILYPRHEDLGNDFDLEQRQVVDAVARRFDTLGFDVTALVCEDELCVEVPDASQADAVARLFVKAQGAGRSCYRRIGRFELSFNGEGTPRVMAMLTVLQRELEAAMTERGISLVADNVVAQPASATNDGRVHLPVTTADDDPVEATSGPVVAIVELLSSSRFGDHKGRAYPFLAGLVRKLGHTVHWLCIPASARLVTPDPTRVDLDDAARQWLASRLLACGATHLLLSEAPAPDWEASLRALVPDVVFFSRRGPLETGESAFWLRWLGHGDAGAKSLIDMAEPDYRCTVMPGYGDDVRPVTTIYSGAACAYAAPLSRNPAFDDVALPEGMRSFGCSFCSGPPKLDEPASGTQLDLLLRQIRAVARAPGSAKSSTELQIDSAWAVHNIDTFLDAVRAAQLPPTSFYLSCRADELMRKVDRFVRAIEIAAASGHRLHLVSIGVENFSPAENARLNKSLSEGQVREAVATMHAWEQQFPGTFHYREHGGLGFILFTPWTSIADLRTNAAAVRDLAPDHARFFLTRRLMLLDNLPITELAKRDGLVGVETSAQRQMFAWLARYCDPGCRHWADEQEIPWHFRDERVAAVCALTVRMCLDGGAPRDPHHELARRVSAGRDGSSLLDAFTALLDVAFEAPKPVDLEHIATAWASVATPVAAKPGLPPSLEHPNQRSILDQFERVAARTGDPLRGFRLRAVSLEVDSSATRLDFARGDDVFHVRVRPASDPSPCFKRSGKFAFSYDAASSEIPAADRSRLMGVVVRLLTGRG